jgi:hypothetical protein
MAKAGPGKQLLYKLPQPNLQAQPTFAKPFFVLFHLDRVGLCSTLGVLPPWME